LLFEKLNLDLIFDNNFDLKELAKYRVLPIYFDTFTICFLTDSLEHGSISSYYSNKLHKSIECKVIHKIDFVKLFDIFVSSCKLYRNYQQKNIIDNVFDYILEKAIDINCSDIHIESFDNIFLIRFRIDGILTEAFIIHEELFQSLSHKIKLISNLDIVTKFVAQDARFTKNIKNNSYDFRVSILPLLYKESIVIRILNKLQSILTIDELGLNSYSENLLKKAISQMHGLVLITGPTGSGKTTTLYSVLNHIKSMEKKIITIEDPIEYRLDYIVQTQVNKKHDFNFNSALKGILRHDPDILMIGEIRDQESVKIAVQSSQTGHLILSTMHTNGAIETIIRLQQLGIENFLIIHALLFVQFQKLIRILCTNCKQKKRVDKEFLKYNHSNKSYVYKPIGCKKCFNSGYIGRKVVCETILIDEHIKKLILNNASYSEYVKYLKIKNFKTIFEDALEQYFQGVTSLEEVIKIDSIKYEL
jgi:general secretion pathway protein E